MPDMNGIEAISAKRAEYPAARIIVLTTYTGDAVQALGLEGWRFCVFCSRACSVKTCSIRFGRFMRGSAGIPPGDRYRDCWSMPPMTRSLSVRSKCCSRCCGQFHKVIAAQPSISEGMQKAYMKSILPKLAARDRTHAVMIAVKRGIIDV